MARARSAAPASGERLWSHKRLLQAGSAAAAIGSILALALTVSDRVTGLFGDDGGKPRVFVDGVDVEVMTLRTFLETTKGDDPSATSAYKKEDLDSDVLAVAVRARYENGSLDDKFDGTETLQARDADGHPVVVGDPQTAEYFLHEENDMCDCEDFFFLPRARSDYRVVVKIRRRGAPASEPVASGKSAWYSP
jgi:hypothetical protein